MHLMTHMDNAAFKGIKQFNRSAPCHNNLQLQNEMPRLISLSLSDLSFQCQNISYGPFSHGMLCIIQTRSISIIDYVWEYPYFIGTDSLQMYDVISQLSHLRMRKILPLLFLFQVLKTLSSAQDKKG